MLDKRKKTGIYLFKKIYEHVDNKLSDIIWNSIKAKLRTALSFVFKNYPQIDNVVVSWRHRNIIQARYTIKEKQTVDPVAHLWLGNFESIISTPSIKWMIQNKYGEEGRLVIDRNFNIKSCE